MSDNAEQSATVTALANYMSDIFDEMMIMDMGVREVVARRLLESGDFYETFDHKYDIDAVLHATKTNPDVFDVKRQSVNVSVALSESDKSRLIIANPDMEITFKESSPHPHAKSYAQRQIDTSRLLSRISHRTGTVLDMGGNYLYHSTHDHAFEVHSCTSLRGEREHHRQTQRNVQLEVADVEIASHCTDGVENCTYFAKVGISVHMLPELDPELVPVVFRNHNLTHMEGVHHYDPEIEVGTSGYITLHDMHWHVVGDMVHFDFDQDSSHGYSHRRDWLIEYSTGWIRTLPDWEYVVHYSVSSIVNGVIHWSMVRLDKSTVGVGRVRPLHRYTDGDKVIALTCPEFDESSGYPVNDPRAYVLNTVHVPPAIFTQVYKYGVSNDTERPDLPLTFDDIKDTVQHLNVVKRIAGVALTVEKKMDVVTVNRIARALYLFIVRRAAMNAVVYGKYTTYMKDIQRRWGDENFFMLAGKAFATTAMFPFFLLADSFSDVIALMAAHMRSTVRENRVIASAQEVVPFRVIQPLRQVASYAEQPFTTQPYAVHTKVDLDDTRGLAEFYRLMKAELSPDMCSLIEERIAADSVADSESVALPQVDTDSLQGEHNAHEQGYMRDDFETREDWHDAYTAYHEHFGDTDEQFVDANVEYTPVVGEPGQIYKYSAARVYEYGLYCIDLAMHERNFARQLVEKTWSGTAPKPERVRHLNNIAAAEIAYYRVVDGQLLGVPSGESYMVAMDPVTCELVMLSQRDAKITTAQDVRADFVMVYKQFRIFNHFEIARSCVSLARKMGSSRPHMPPITLIDGVPGCGKTHEIVHTFSKSDLYVCSVKSTVEQVVDWLLKVNPSWSRQHVEARVRTVDSFEVNSHRQIPYTDTLWVDEALMFHSGAIEYMIQRSRARAVKLYGDTQQIRFIERGSKIGVMRFALYKYLTSVEYRNISARMPVDVTALIRVFYPEWRRSEIKTLSSVVNSIEYIQETDVKSALYTVAQNGWTYLTVLQADKSVMLHGTGFVDGKAYDVDTSILKPGSPVYSVHEAQGRTFGAAQVCRLNPQTAGVFDSRPHQLVMMSRATVRVRYVSAAQTANDSVALLIEAFQKAGGVDKDDVMLETPDWLQERLEADAMKLGIAL